MMSAAGISGPCLRIVARGGTRASAPAASVAATRRLSAAAGARPSEAGDAVRRRMGSKHFAYGLGGGLLAAGLLGATGSADDLEDGREGRDELPFRRG